MRIFFWFVLLFLGNVANTLQAQQLDDILEKRIESWRPYLQSDRAPAVIDSCKAILPALSSTRKPRLRALALSLQASATAQIGKREAALFLHRQALALRLKSLGARHLETANSYQNIGNCYLTMDLPEQAGPFLKKALAIKENLLPQGSPQLIRIYNNVGQYYLDQSSFVKAQPYFESALAIAERQFGPLQLQLIPRLVTLADLYSAENKQDRALNLLQRAFRIQKDSNWEDVSMKVMLLQKLGVAYGANGAYEEALKWLDEALQLTEQQLTPELGIRSNILTCIGKVLLDLGDFKAAEDNLRSALPSLPGRNKNRAEALKALGLALRYQDRRDAVDTLVVAGNIFLGFVHSSADRKTVTGVWMNIGSYFLDRHEFQAALYYFKKAFDYVHNAAGAADETAACLDKIGVCYMNMNREDSASIIWTKLLENKHLSQALVYSVFYHSGELNLRQENWETAFSCFQKALGMLKGAGPIEYLPFPFEYAQAFTAMARVFRAKAQQHNDPADWQQALNWAEQAIETLNRLKTQLHAASSAIELQQIFDTQFDIAVTANIALNKPEAAWRFSEMLKGNFLQKLSWQAALSSNFRLPQDWVKNEIAWNKALLYYQRLRLESTEQSAEKQAAFADSVQRISARLYQLRSDISSRFPEVYKLLYEPDIPALADVQATLSTDQSLLVYHWGAPERLYAFIIRRDSFFVHTLTTTADTPHDILSFIQLCAENPYDLPDTARTAYCDELVSLGQSLYTQLVAPLEPMLRTQVLIVPDASLCLMPFEALIVQRNASSYRMDQHRYWLQAHSISYVHSAAVWSTMQHRPLPEGKQPILIVAPDFAQNTRGLAELKYNQSEAASVKSATKGNTLLGSAARKSAFIESADRYAALHLATHGVMDDRDPLKSYIAFTERLNDSPDSNLLYVSDIYSASFQTELVVLSACQTASGHLYRGEGLISIAQAFQFAGVQSLVASLWNVDDQRTPALMESFFKNLWKKMPKNLALTKAKCSYLEAHRGLDAHPCFWAGLLLTGSEKALTHTGSGYWPWVFGGLSILLVMLIAFQLYRNKSINYRNNSRT